MITGALEVAVVGRAFLIALNRADRTVHIKNDLLGRVALVNPVHSYTGQVHEERKILWLRSKTHWHLLECLQNRHLLFRDNQQGRPRREVQKAKLKTQNCGVPSDDLLYFAFSVLHFSFLLRCESRSFKFSECNCYAM
jgi:hypothetical protein